MPLEADLQDGERWTFDESVAREFDLMLERSIPGYGAMRRLVYDVGRRFIRPKTTVLDLGCARGEALAPFVEQLGAPEFGCRFVGLEASKPMLAAAARRFEYGLEDAYRQRRPDVRIVEHDLRNGLEGAPIAGRVSVCLAVLTLQFVPIEYRAALLADVYRNLADDGCLILVEKVIVASPKLDAVFRDLHYSAKIDAGYSEEEVERKRLALEGVLVPQTARANEALLEAAGFRAEPFWRCLNFAGWLAVPN